MHLDASTRQRLERLRATDVTGIYAGDEPSVGTDPGGAIAVTVDPTLRVRHVEIRRIDAVRTPAAVAQAFEAAYRAAIARRLPRPRDERAARPVARRVRRVSAQPTAERLDRHQTPYRDGVRPRGRIAGAVTGSSTNECVRVSLPPAGPRGVVDVEPGWLAIATRARLGAAITEAFAVAYSRRDES